MYTMLIRIGFFHVLCHLQILFDDLNVLLHFLEHFKPNKESSYWITLVDRSIATPPIQCLKWTHSNGLILSILACKIYKWKVLLPLLGLMYYIHPQHVFKDLIHHLCLPICLWMICCTKFHLYPQTCKQFLPKHLSELSISV